MLSSAFATGLIVCTLSFGSGDGARDFDLLVNAPTRQFLGEAPAAMESAATSVKDAMQPCGHQRYCVYEADGSVHHWAQEFLLETIPTDRWGTPQWDKPIRRKVFLTGGYKDVAARQREYMSWLDRNRVQNGVRLATDGRLSLRTLKIPALVKRHEAYIAWIRFKRQQSSCRKDFSEFFGRLRSPSHARRESDFSFPNAWYRARAEALWALEARIVDFEARVETLRPAATEWGKLYEGDHLEPEQLPPGFVVSLSEADRDLERALEDVFLLEDQ